MQASEWGGMQGVVQECGTRALKTVRPSSVPVYLGTPIARARAILRSKVDEFVWRLTEENEFKNLFSETSQAGPESGYDAGHG